MRKIENQDPRTISLDGGDLYAKRRAYSFAVAMTQRARYNREKALELIQDNPSESKALKVLAQAFILQGRLDDWFIG